MRNTPISPPASAALAAIGALLATHPATAEAGRQQRGDAPRIARAVTRDSDGDGRVDGLTLTYSKRVRSRPRAKGPFPFGVKGHRVAALQRARGRTLVAELEEGRPCDVAGSPRVAYRRPRRRQAGVTDLAGRSAPSQTLDMERRDRSPPRVVCAETLDSDGDGHMDGVTLTYSKAVRHRRQTAGPFPFVVEGYGVDSVERARGRWLGLRLRERAALDTDARPAITYRQPRRRARRRAVTDRARRQAFNGVFRTTRDGVAPRLVSARTGDGDSDGLLDRIQVELSEPVSSAGVGAFGAEGTTVESIGRAGPAELLLELRERGAPDTGARPSLSYTGAGRPVRDRSGNAAARGSATPADGAPPVLVAGRTADLGGVSGRIDRLQLAFSEPISHPADSDGAYPFAVGGYAIASAGTAWGARLDLELSEGAADDTGARPAARYARGAGAAVRDAAGNEAVDRLLGSTLDGAAPRLRSATTLDGDGDGILDLLGLSFTEPVVHAAEPGAGSFAVAGLQIDTALAAAGGAIGLALAEAAGPNSGARPSVSYAPDGSNDVTDASGNPAPAATVLQATDGAPPVAVSSETADTDDDTRIDRLAVVFSEPLDHPQDSEAPFPLGASGHALAAVGAAAGAFLPIDLVEGPGPDTGSAPALSYTGAAGVAVRDLSGLEAAERTYAGLTRDAVAPRLVAAETGDADLDGRLDRVELRYSEEVTGSTATAPFTVAGRTLQAVSYASDRVSLQLAEGSLDTEETPSVGYVPGDMRDVPEGAGDSAQAAAALTAQPTADRAPPVLTQATTVDANVNGKLDGVGASFSEPVSHPADGSAPFAIGVGGRTVTAVSAASGDSLAATLAEGSDPDGGSRPSVSVGSVPTPSERIRDLAPAPNDAGALTFTNTGDGVRPVLISAQLGESTGGSCRRSPAVDGRLDCVRATWSEPISHAADGDGTYPLSLDSGYLIAAAGIGAVTSSDSIDVPLEPKPSPDRDKGAGVSYNDAIDEPVRDAAGNESLPGTKQATRACADGGSEDNDARESANPQLAPGAPSPERRCGFDDDWFRVTTGIEGVLKAVARPGAALASELELVDAVGSLIASAPANPAGANDLVQATGLLPATIYWVHVSAPGPQEGTYCVATSITAADEPNCGPNVGELIFSEVGLDTDRFVELKNVSDYPLDLSQFHLRRGAAPVCDIQPAGGGDPEIVPGQYAVVTATGAGGGFSCGAVADLDPAGEALELLAGVQIDRVDLGGILQSALASGHSLGLKPAAENGGANDDVARNWCRTFASDTKGQPGDGCDEYRVNEVLFNPSPSGAAGTQGRAFVELAGNLPAKPGSELLGGWALRSIDGLTGDGTPDFVLPPGATPRDEGTYVIGDGVNASPAVTYVSPADLVWAAFDPTGGPRGLQLLRPSPPPSSCGSALADAFGWSTAGQSFSHLSDAQRNCATVEGQEYVVPTQGRSAARDNLSSVGDTSYNAANDGGQSSQDFCPQTTPSPGALNVRPGCS